MKYIQQFGKFLSNKMSPETAEQNLTKLRKDQIVKTDDKVGKGQETGAKEQSKKRLTTKDKEHQENMNRLQQLHEIILKQHIFAREQAGENVENNFKRPFVKNFKPKRLGYNRNLKRKIKKIELKKLIDSGKFKKYRYKKKPPPEKYFKKQVDKSELAMGYWCFEKQPEQHVMPTQEELEFKPEVKPGFMTANVQTQEQQKQQSDKELIQNEINDQKLQKQQFKDQMEKSKILTEQDAQSVLSTMEQLEYDKDQKVSKRGKKLQFTKEETAETQSTIQDTKTKIKQVIEEQETRVQQIIAQEKVEVSVSKKQLRSQLIKGSKNDKPKSEKAVKSSQDKKKTKEKE